MSCKQILAKLQIPATVWALSLPLLVFVAHGASADEGGAPGDWASRYSTARSVGIGGAFVASAEDPLGVVWNPAALSRMNQNEVHFESAQLFEDTSINSISFGVPGARFPSLGITVMSLSSGTIERTSDLNESLGSFGESDFAVYLSASKNLSPKLSLGTNLKIASQSIEEFSAVGVGLDVGALYDVTGDLRVGVSLLNLGGPSLALRETDEKFPGELRAGASWRFLSGRGLISGELDHRSGWDTSMHLGSEIWAHPSLALRLGFDDASATGGLGFRLAQGLQIDYGISDHELGLSNRVGLSYQFGGYRAESQAKPRVFSPLGTQAVTRFELTSRTKASPESWQLSIVDPSDREIRRFGGQGEPPSHLMWDGKDEAGVPLADGTYRYQFTVVDAEGRSMQGVWDGVEIYTGGPQGSVPAVVD